MWQPSAEERLRSVLLVRRAAVVVFVAFAVVLAAGVVLVVVDPSMWPVVAVAFPLCRVAGVRAARRLRAVNRALPGIEAELRRAAGSPVGADPQPPSGMP